MATFSIICLVILLMVISIGIYKLLFIIVKKELDADHFMLICFAIFILFAIVYTTVRHIIIWGQHLNLTP